MSILISLIVSAIAVFVAGYILPGVSVDNFVTALVVAVLMGVVNAFIKPILTILTLPITIMTLGLFMFVINALLILLIDYLVPGFKVDGLLWALVFSLVVSIISSVLGSLAK